MACVPDTLVEQWSAKGRDETLSLFQKAFKKGCTPLTVSNEFCSLLYNLLRRCVGGELGADETAAFLSDLASTLINHGSLSSDLADLLSVLDADVACSESKEQQSAFRALVRACRGLVGDSLLKERLDMDSLETVSLVPSKANFNQRYVKTKTKLFYKQHKFNLFREENEGYSKLVSELGHERRSVEAVPAILDNIRSLIGRFNLDPNRVLDVLMEACSCYHDDREVFLALLRGYPCEQTTFVNILGFKFQSCQSSESSPSLFRLAAVLLHEGLVALGDLYTHLSVSDAVLKDFYETSMEDARLTAKKAMIVSLTEKTDEERQKEVELEKGKLEYRKKLLDLETNQKLGLLQATILLGDWPTVSSILVLLPPFLPAWCPAISQSLCQLLHYLVDPLYRNYSPKATKYSQPSLSPEYCSQCHKFPDLTPHVFQILSCLGPSLHSDPILLAKILRLGRAFFKEHTGCVGRVGMDEMPAQEIMDVFHGFLTALDEAILPSLSLLSCNCGMAEEAWSMVKQLPYERRYELYGRWKNRSYGLYPELMEAKTQTLAQGRYIMKRLTKDNVRPSGRMIGKLSHSNPGIIFEYVLSQIQRYDNFIIPVVDALKYLTPLAYDVLAYGVIEALGHPQKERLKHEDTNISNWLQGLANFSANVFKKYPIELTGLLQYVANQLKAAKSFDLLVLKEVVQKMSGIEISEEITHSQLEALAGGELLKAEGAYFSQVRNTKKSSHRLREALLEADLSLPLCLLMAQQRDGIIYREGANRHLKLVCNLYDNCLDTLVQFGGFLSTHLNPDDYNYRVPPLDVLGLEYYIPADAAFFMLRPLIKSSVSEKFLQLEKAAKAAKTEKEPLNKQAKASSQESSYYTAWYSVLDPIVEAARQLHSPKVWEDISAKLYTTFWSLSLYDLYVPTGRYEEEVRKAREAIKELEDKLDMSSKRKKEQERSSALIEKLQEEKQRQEDNHRLVNSCIRQEKDSWFTAKVTKNRTITQFLQLCIYPRCRFTATDAIFCAKFVHMLHLQQTPNFSTLLFLDRTFSDVSYSVACCTENEVRRYGRFLGAILEVVSKWHNKEALYEQECARTPGFISMMRSSAGGAEKMQYLDYENYRHITFKWHFKLTKALVILLESKDYMQVRNGLIVLTKVLPYYPKVYHLSIALEKRVEKIMEEEKEKRPDLYALAIGYAGMLKSHKQNLVQESQFHIREERVKAQKTDGDTNGKLAPTPLPPPPVEKERKEEKRESSRETEERALVVNPPEEKPQKIAKVKGAATAAEAKAAAALAVAAEEKEQEKEKGEENKSSEKASEVVAAVSTPNPPEPSVAARRESKGGGAGNSGKTKAEKGKAEKSGKMENGSNHVKKTEGEKGEVKKAEGEKVEVKKTEGARVDLKKAEGARVDLKKAEGAKVDLKKAEGARGEVKKMEGEKGVIRKALGDDKAERRSGSRERPVSVKVEDQEEKVQKSKQSVKATEKSELSTPGSKTGTPVGATPPTKVAKLAQISPAPGLNGPVGMTPSPTRAGQRRQLSQTETPEPGPGKDPKRRKVAEQTKQDDQPGKDRDAETRKRDRSLDKEASEAKRRKDSPRDDSSISSSSPQPDTKRRVVKVGSKKEGSSRLQEVSPLTKKVKPESQKTVSAKKEKEEKVKKHASRAAKKEKT